MTRELLLSAAVGAAAIVSLTPIVESARPLADRVTIRRDRFGVPHILAEDEESGAYALGYAQAEDHALEIARRYLLARGEAARVFGRSVLESDVAMHRLDNIGAARSALGQLGKGFRRSLHAFAAGVNRYLEEHRAELPAWVPARFDAADVLAHTRAGAVTGALGPGAIADLRRKYEKTGEPPPTSAPSTIVSAEDDGSNALALGGSRTASGKPILLGNPHLRWSSLYWEAHVTIPGEVNFYGSTLAGLPALRAGFNDRLGYVQTNNDPDLDDIYALRLDGAATDRYLFDGRSRALVRRSVEVSVLEADGRLATERREFRDTHLGPVVYRTADRVFVLRSMSLESWRYFEGFHELVRARDLRGFLSRLERNLIPTSNFTYADADGNVLYQWNARLPRREDRGVSYELDVPGDTSRYFWRGVHRVRDLPRLLNPRGGAIQNANNSPWWTSLSDRLDMARYPSYVERNPLALRPQRALLLLDGTRRFSPDEVRALKFDVRVLLADRVLDDLLAAARAVASPSTDLTEAIGVLSRWDRQAASESHGTALFLRFWDAYRQPGVEPFAVAWSADAPVATPRGLASPERAVAALERAAAAVRKDHGRLDVPWGEVVRFRAGGIDVAGDGADGSYGLYRVMRFDAARPGSAPRAAIPGARVAGRFDPAEPPAGFGDAWVLLVHFTRPVEAWSILAYGQSSRPDSPHGRDQIERFARHELRRIWFTEAEIAANLERSYRPPR
jgi:acyl-homoserine-lactone acylase